MDAAKSSAIGFLTVVEHAEFGLFGGYLLLNAAGRPLEFHCTSPVKADRALEILYGPTLDGYLYERIAEVLLAKAKAAPVLVCTDLPELSRSASIEMPLVLIRPADDGGAGYAESFALGSNRAALIGETAGQRQEIQHGWSSLETEDLDLLEPFARIREALEEAHKGARAAA